MPGMSPGDNSLRPTPRLERQGGAQVSLKPGERHCRASCPPIRTLGTRRSPATGPISIRVPPRRPPRAADPPGGAGAGPQAGRDALTASARPRLVVQGSWRPCGQLGRPLVSRPSTRTLTSPNEGARSSLGGDRADGVDAPGREARGSTPVNASRRTIAAAGAAGSAHPRQTRPPPRPARVGRLGPAPLHWAFFLSSA